MVSRDFGQLVGMRHLISGIDWAIAGAAMVAAPAPPIPVTLRNSLRFMGSCPFGCECRAFVSRLTGSMKHPVRNFHAELAPQTKKPGLLAKAGPSPGLKNWSTGSKISRGYATGS